MTGSSAKPRLRGVLFDFDGVIIDSPPLHARAWAEVFRPYGIELPPERLHRVEGYKAKEIGAGIVREYGLAIDDAELDGIVRQRRELYQSFKPDGMRPDARRAVVQLKSLGVSAAIVSGAAYQMIAAVLAGGELQLFDAIVSADAYRLAKPHPEPFLTGCAKLGFSPTECAVVENAPLGIASARAAGITVFGVSTTLPAQELAGADRVIPNLDSLIPAMDDYFIFQ